MSSPQQVWDPPGLSGFPAYLNHYATVIEQIRLTDMVIYRQTVVEIHFSHYRRKSPIMERHVIMDLCCLTTWNICTSCLLRVAAVEW